MGRGGGERKTPAQANGQRPHVPKSSLFCKTPDTELSHVTPNVTPRHTPGRNRDTCPRKTVCTDAHSSLVHKSGNHLSAHGLVSGSTKCGRSTPRMATWPRGGTDPAGDISCDLTRMNRPRQVNLYRQKACQRLAGWGGEEEKRLLTGLLGDQKVPRLDRGDGYTAPWTC